MHVHGDPQLEITRDPLLAAFRRDRAVGPPAVNRGFAVSTNFEIPDDVPAPRHAMTRGREYAGAVLLQTRRLLMRELRFADVPELSALHHEPRVRSLALDVLPCAFLEIAAIVIQSNRIYGEQPGLGRWRAEDAQGRFVSLFSLLPSGRGADIEFTALPVPGACGVALAIEGARAIRDHAFGALEVPRLLAFCRPQDALSSTILRRIGFASVRDSEKNGQLAREFVIERDRWLHLMGGTGH